MRNGGSLRGVPVDPPVEWFPPMFVGTVLNFGFNLRDAIDADVDFISMVSIETAPSGAGELTVQSISLLDETISITMTGGQPRVYTHAITAATTDGSLYVFKVKQAVSPSRDTDQAPEPPDWGLSAPVTWSYVPSLDFTNVRNSAYLACTGI